MPKLRGVGHFYSTNFLALILFAFIMEFIVTRRDAHQVRSGNCHSGKNMNQIQQ